MFGIGEAAVQSGVMIETIRYYERQSIVTKPGRTAAGRRVYTKDDIARLRFVKRCRDLGFPIPEIKSLLGLTDGSQANCSSARIIAHQHLQLMQTKISDLKRMQTALEGLVKLCVNEDDTCPILTELLSEEPPTLAGQ